MIQNFPELDGKITGDNFPPPPIAELMLKLLSGVQLLGLGLVFFGEREEVILSLLFFKLKKWSKINTKSCGEPPKYST